MSEWTIQPKPDYPAHYRFVLDADGLTIAMTQSQIYAELIVRDHQAALQAEERVRTLEEALESVADATMADGQPCWCLNDGYWDGTHTDTCREARKALTTPERPSVDTDLSWPGEPALTAAEVEEAKRVTGKKTAYEAHPELDWNAKCMCPAGWLQANFGYHRGPYACPRYDLDVARRGHSGAPTDDR